MGKGLSIWLIFLIIACVVCDFLVLKTQNYSGTTVDFIASTGDKIQVAGSNEINVVASGVGYIRIASGDLVIKGEPISGRNFSATGVLAGGRWDMLDGESISITATSGSPINVIFYPSGGTWALTILVTLVFGCVLFLLGYMFSDLS